MDEGLVGENIMEDHVASGNFEDHSEEIKEGKRPMNLPEKPKHAKELFSNFEIAEIK